jgi:hypothetical protein
MRKTLLLFVFFTASVWLNAQNVQLHYDMGKDRKYLTSTVEMFKPDKWGSTFFFIDMDYGYPGIKGVSLGYWEIARGLKFWKSPFEIHVEYNGGFGQFKDSLNDNRAFQINDAWLIGGNYTWNNADFTKIFTLEAMYKNIRGIDDKSFQLTGVWTLKFFKNKITCSGFADFWKEKSIHGEYIFLSEPQFWYNFTPNFSLGSEIELSSNFGGHNGFMVNPTAGAKWTF